jgi:hypothetical protein
MNGSLLHLRLPHNFNRVGVWEGRWSLHISFQRFCLWIRFCMHSLQCSRGSWPRSGPSKTHHSHLACFTDMDFQTERNTEKEKGAPVFSVFARLVGHPPCLFESEPGREQGSPRSHGFVRHARHPAYSKANSSRTKSRSSRFARLAADKEKATSRGFQGEATLC